MLNQESEAEVSHQRQTNHHLPNDHHNPLNDHDYCSPNKRIAPQQSSDKSNKDSHQSSNFMNPTTLPSSLPVQTTVASSSSSPDPQRNELRFDNSRISKTFSNDNLSDSSSSISSSLSSSFASAKELVIAQESRRPEALKSAASKDAAPKRKVGRPPGSTKKEMDDGLDQAAGRVRAKRARQNTSVTDKSEWIMGDDQIDSVLSEQLGDELKEKRHKPNREHDSAFNQYTSSDYSSSDAESDQDSDCNSEDDPSRLWCICQKPHEGKFMICCDICKDWFHGHCVGVTKLMGDRFEKQGKEWFCGECQEKLRSGIPRNAIPKKIVKKEKEKKKSQQLVHSKRGRGRPRKSESLAREIATRASQRNTRKSSSSLDPKLGVDNGRLRKNLARSDVRSESFDDFQDQQKLKQLIRERKKAFFYKRHLAEQQKADRRSELGLGRQALTANLSDSLDSLASSTSTPNMSNLPINIKSEHKERSKPNIVLQINTKKDSGADQNNPSSRIVTAIVRSPKKSKRVESNDPTVNDLFTAEPIQINKKVKIQASAPSAVAPKEQAAGDTNTSNGDGATIRKRSNSCSSSSKNEKSPTEHSEPATPKKKRKDSDSSAPNGSLILGGSRHIAQKIKESLETRSKQIKDLEVTSNKIEELATEIEGHLNECFKEGTQKYNNKFRSLIFNLRDHKNQGLVRNVLTGEIAPARLVRMSPDEMASHELAKWRERENKHSIELIKRDAQLAAQQVIVKKTHKGEEVISAPSLNESDDAAAKADNQEPPTTPTKHSTRETRADGSKITLTPPPASGTVKSSGPLKMKITGLGSDSFIKASQDNVGPSSACVSDSLPFLDTTKDHKAHIFDINCKICTKQQLDTPDADSESKHEAYDEKERRPSESEQQSEQPKRLRISIDTKLNPASLSRLSEPLVKPILQPLSPMDVDSYSPSRVSPAAKLTAMDEDEDDVYDPEASNLATHKSMEIDPLDTQSLTEPCWTGSITMPDIAKFSASARAVSGSVSFMKGEINQTLMVCGRIAPDQVQGYIKKLKTTTKNQILIIQLFPLAEDDKKNFDTFFDYLYSRNRYGVIQTSPQILKDFYILPIHEKSNIPEILKPIKGPGLDRKEPNCLLGLLVRSKRSPSTSYTPASLK